ncbi:MAG: extracellular solute-binding protein family 1 [Paenibacillaceae bacterium]|jgi:putative aldouronate transport system substrate-binding protein|nr:extracellular solute-binding protein family 1 [Paenibacillaceae bacterium]
MAKVYGRIAAVLAAVMLTASVSAGCAEKEEAGKEVQPAGTATPAPTPYIEIWRDITNSTIPLEKDGPYSKMIQKDTGIGIYMPVVPWDGGNTYVQRLNTRIAAGDLPDLFLPWKGNETALMKQGALADLTDLLPKYAPSVWSRIPKEMWDIVRSADISGKGRIYYIPQVQTYTYYGAYIRKDWLDRVGMKMPATKDEYVEVLKAFRDKDANGNGDPNDEIPLIGREQGRWMDHIFGMFGVAMWEGYPMWDLYDGKLTYSAVTPNMKAALEFARMLYAEKLLDPNTLLNKSEEWTSKIYNDKVGNYFHINYGQAGRVENIAKVNKDVNLVALPLPKVEGYNGFITKTQLNKPQWVIANKNEQTTINALKLLEWAADPKNADKALLGVEGMHYEVKDGKTVILPPDPAKQEARPLTSFITDLDQVKKEMALEVSSANPTKLPAYQQREKLLLEMQPFGKTIAGDGMPASIFEGFSDLKNHTMYQEYMANIILGVMPISKFEEFVDKWNKNGGAEVTERARAWYDSMNKK